MEAVRGVFHAQLATVMDSLLAAAVCEIAKIFESSLCEQQAELVQKAEEISMLRCRLEKMERRYKAKEGGTEEGELSSGVREGSLRQQTQTGSVLNGDKNSPHSEPEEELRMLKEEVTGQEGASIKNEPVRSRSVTGQPTDGDICISQAGYGSPKPDSGLLQAGDWTGLNSTRGGVSGLENPHGDRNVCSATASSSIGNDPSCFQPGFGSEETSNEGDASFVFLDQESENQNSEEGSEEKEADLIPATSAEAPWRPRDERVARGHVNHARRITNVASRDPLRPQLNAQLTLNHPTTPAGGNGRPYSCPYCTKCFTYPSHQRRHLLRHTGVRLHPCQFCDKSFLTPSELTVHTRTHTGERPFGCAQCGKRFARSGNLRAHQRDVHMGKRPFACIECGKRFAHRGNLRVHNHRVHQGDPYYTEAQPEPDGNQNAI
ncbi:zinc finger protein 777-like isoform X2 [Cyprinodon tularosa]|uniref:zinc finger protein 777-like isoform X2 n=1 Tax=Cyprinodon tularosa TaxID=77115 RepID=UPI0018E21535|nr:zinc finger protein 777-like isoform X2 [Cyprinodon tularosa]